MGTEEELPHTTVTKSLKDEENEKWEENMCINALELLEQMRYKIGFLRFNKSSSQSSKTNHNSNVAESASTTSTCPQQQQQQQQQQSSSIVMSHNISPSV